MDRQKAKLLREAMQEALKQVETDVGVSINIGSISYNDNTASVKVEVADVNENGEVYNKEAEDYKKYASSYGLDPASLGKSFCHGGKIFIVTGLSTRKRKYPVMAKDAQTGKKYKFPTDVVNLYLGKVSF
jgi:hypothetical protein